MPGRLSSACSVCPLTLQLVFSACLPFLFDHMNSAGRRDGFGVVRQPRRGDDGAHCQGRQAQDSQLVQAAAHGNQMRQRNHHRVSRGNSNSAARAAGVAVAPNSSRKQRASDQTHESAARILIVVLLPAALFIFFFLSAQDGRVRRGPGEGTHAH